MALWLFTYHSSTSGFKEYFTPTTNPQIIITKIIRPDSFLQQIMETPIVNFEILEIKQKKKDLREAQLWVFVRFKRSPNLSPCAEPNKPDEWYKERPNFESSWAEPNITELKHGTSLVSISHFYFLRLSLSSSSVLCFLASAPDLSLSSPLFRSL